MEPIKLKIRMWDLLFAGFSTAALAFAMIKFPSVYGLSVYEIYIAGFLFIISAICMHEVGHMLTLSYYLKKPIGFVTFNMTRYNKIWLESGEQKDYENIDSRIGHKVYLWGIIAGLLIVIVGIIASPLYLVLIPLYFAGTKSDVDSMMKAVKKTWLEDNKNEPENKEQDKQLESR